MSDPMARLSEHERALRIHDRAWQRMHRIGNRYGRKSERYLAYREDMLEKWEAVKRSMGQSR